MEEILLRLQSVQDKVQALTTYVAALESDCDRLEKALEKAEARVEEQEETVKQWEEKYEAAKAVSGLGNGEDREELRAKIDSYLEEIDFCLKIYGDQS